MAINIKQEPEGGLSFFFDGSQVIVPEYLVADRVFMKHFAEDFLLRPSPEEIAKAVACCDTIVGIPGNDNKTHWIRLNADGTQEEWTTERQPGLGGKYRARAQRKPSRQL